MTGTTGGDQGQQQMGTGAAGQQQSQQGQLPSMSLAPSAGQSIPTLSSMSQQKQQQSQQSQQASSVLFSNMGENYLSSYYDPLHAHANMNCAPASLAPQQTPTASDINVNMNVNVSTTNTNTSSNPLNTQSLSNPLQLNPQMMFQQQLATQQQIGTTSTMTPVTQPPTLVPPSHHQSPLPIPTIVTCVNGQQVVLNATAAATLFDTKPNTTATNNNNNNNNNNNASSSSSSGGAGNTSSSQHQQIQQQAQQQQNVYPIQTYPTSVSISSGATTDFLPNNMKKRKGDVALNANISAPGNGSSNTNNGGGGQRSGLTQEEGSTATVSASSSNADYQTNFSNGGSNSTTAVPVGAPNTNAGHVENCNSNPNTSTTTQFPPLPQGQQIIPMETMSKPTPSGGSLSTQDNKNGTIDHTIPSSKIEERRRYDRNLREQQRSHKISQQIKTLRDVLSDAKVSFKPNKYSILTSVADYIKELQNRAIFLDGEHKKLIQTIRQTTDMVNSVSVPSNNNNTNNNTNNTANNAGQGPPQEEDRTTLANEAELIFVEGLDYHGVFDQCVAALGVVALDGRFLACNTEFENVIGLTKEQLQKQSLFNLLQRQDADSFFQLMNSVLQKRGENIGNSDSADTETQTKRNLNSDMWSGMISRPNTKCRVNITVTRTREGVPKFITCALFEPLPSD